MTSTLCRGTSLHRPSYTLPIATVQFERLKEAVMLMLTPPTFIGGSSVFIRGGRAGIPLASHVAISPVTHIGIICLRTGEL